MTTPSSDAAAAKPKYIPPARRAAMQKEAQERNALQQRSEQVAESLLERTAGRYERGIHEENGRWKKTPTHEEKDVNKFISKVDRPAQTAQKATNSWRQPDQSRRRDEQAQNRTAANADEMDSKEDVDGLGKMLSSLSVSSQADQMLQKTTNGLANSPWEVPSDRIRQPPAGWQPPKQSAMQKEPIQTTSSSRSATSTPRRPETSDAVARRMIAGALGIRLPKKDSSNDRKDSNTKEGNQNDCR